jgi:hypothetical protein
MMLQLQFSELEESMQIFAPEPACRSAVEWELPLKCYIGHQVEPAAKEIAAYVVYEAHVRFPPL